MRVSVSEGQGHAQTKQSVLYSSHAYPHYERDHLGDRPPRTDRSIASHRTLATAARARDAGLRAHFRARLEGEWYRTDDVTDDARTERRARSIARGVVLLDDARDGSNVRRNPAPCARLETRSRDASERFGRRRGFEFTRTVPSGDPHAPSARGFRQTNVSMGDERVRGGWAVEVREAHERGVRQRVRGWRHERGDGAIV